MRFSNIRAVAISIPLSLSILSCDKQPTPPPSAATPSQPVTPAQDAPAAQTTAPAQKDQTSSALASAEGELPGLTVELQELKRTAGDTLTLKLAFVNTGQQQVALDQFGGPGINMWSISGISLVDIVGKKKYFTASDAEGKCLCSIDIPRLEPKARVNLWAKFPAPPPDVQTISVLIPRFAPIEEIPIS
jgi:hypothetical protein